MILEFVEPGPALLVKNTKKILVIADLHLGIESDLEFHGIHFRSRSRQRQQKAIACIEETSPDLVLLLGDVKHSIPGTTRQEYHELPTLLGALRALAPLRVMPGNHDIGIERFLHEGELLQKEGEIIDGTGFMHGHTYPSPALSGHLIICGHHHPQVYLQDEVGCSLRAPAYMSGGLEEACFSRSQVPVNTHPERTGSKKETTTGSRRVAPRPRRQGKKPLPDTVDGIAMDAVLEPCSSRREEISWPLYHEGRIPGNPAGTRVILMPAFNELSGFDVCRIIDTPTSPVSRFMNRASCEIYLTDGTYIGPLSAVECHEPG